MGTLIGHVAPGFAFALIGLWHLLNAISSYIRCPWEFRSQAWFPLKSSKRPGLRFMELYLIIFGSLLSIASELFIFPSRHQPLDGNFSIPYYHLNNFEHSSISLFFLIYASFTLAAAVLELQLPPGLFHLLAGVAFSQELLLFHFHSADHMGLEGQYHWLLQLAVATCMVCSVLEAGFPKSILLVIVRCMGILLQGLWLIQMGLVLWIPMFVPAGCSMKQRDGHDVVKCGDETSEMRAKALANLQFNWYLAGVLVFTLMLFVFMSGRRNNSIPYERVEGHEVELGESPGTGAGKHRNTSSHSSIDTEDDHGFPVLELGR